MLARDVLVKAQAKHTGSSHREKNPPEVRLTRTQQLRLPRTPARYTSPYMQRMHAAQPVLTVIPNDRPKHSGDVEDIGWASGPRPGDLPPTASGPPAMLQPAEDQQDDLPIDGAYDALIASLFDAEKRPPPSSRQRAGLLPLTTMRLVHPRAINTPSPRHHEGRGRVALAPINQSTDRLPATRPPHVSPPVKIGRLDDGVMGPSIMDTAFQASVLATSFDNMSAAKSSNPGRVMHSLRGSLRRIDGMITALYRQQRFTTDAGDDALSSGRSSESDSTKLDVDDQHKLNNQQQRVTALAQEIKELKSTLGVLVMEASSHRDAMAAVEVNELRHHQHLKEAQATAEAAQREAAGLRAELELMKAARDALSVELEELREAHRALKSKGVASGIMSDEDENAALSSDAVKALLAAGDDDPITSFSVSEANLTSPKLLHLTSPADNNNSFTSGASNVVALLPARYFLAPRGVSSALPSSAAGPLSFISVGVQGYRSLLEHYTEHMPIATATFQQTVRRVAEHTGAILYKAMWSSCQYLLVAPTALDALVFALSLQLELVEQQWPHALDASAEAGRVEDSESQPIWAGLRARIGIASVGTCDLSVVGDPTQPYAVEYVSPAAEDAVILCRIACGGLTCISDDLAKLVAAHSAELHQPLLFPHVTLTSAIESREVYGVCPLSLAERVSDFQRVVAASAATRPDGGGTNSPDETLDAAGIESPPESHIDGGVSELELLLGRVQTAQSQFHPVPTSEGWLLAEQLHPYDGSADVKASRLPAKGHLTLVVMRLCNTAGLIASPAVDGGVLEIVAMCITDVCETTAKRHFAQLVRRPPSDWFQNLLRSRDAATSATTGHTTTTAALGVAGAASPAAVEDQPLVAKDPAQGPLYWTFVVQGGADKGMLLAAQLDSELMKVDWPREVLKVPLCETVEWRGVRVLHGPRFSLGVRSLPNPTLPYVDPLSHEVRYIGDDVLVAHRLCDLASAGQVLVTEDDGDQLLRGVVPRPIMLPLQVPINPSQPNRRQQLLLVVPRTMLGRIFVFHGMTSHAVWHKNASYGKLRAEIQRHDGRWARRATCISDSPHTAMAGDAPSSRLAEDWFNLRVLHSHMALVACPLLSRHQPFQQRPLPTLPQEAALRHMEAIETASMLLLDGSLSETVTEPTILPLDLLAMRGLFAAAAEALKEADPLRPFREEGEEDVVRHEENILAASALRRESLRARRQSASRLTTPGMSRRASTTAQGKDVWGNTADTSAIRLADPELAALVAFHGEVIEVCGAITEALRTYLGNPASRNPAEVVVKGNDGGDDAAFPRALSFLSRTVDVLATRTAIGAAAESDAMPSDSRRLSVRRSHFTSTNDMAAEHSITSSVARIALGQQRLEEVLLHSGVADSTSRSNITPSLHRAVTAVGSTAMSRASPPPPPSADAPSPHHRANAAMVTRSALGHILSVGSTVRQLLKRVAPVTASNVDVYS